MIWFKELEVTSKKLLQNFLDVNQAKSIEKKGKGMANSSVKTNICSLGNLEEVTPSTKRASDSKVLFMKNSPSQKTVEIQNRLSKRAIRDPIDSKLTKFSRKKFHNTRMTVKKNFLLIDLKNQKRERDKKGLRISKMKKQKRSEKKIKTNTKEINKNDPMLNSVNTIHNFKKKNFASLMNNQLNNSRKQSQNLKKDSLCRRPFFSVKKTLNQNKVLKSSYQKCSTMNREKAPRPANNTLSSTIRHSVKLSKTPLKADKIKKKLSKSIKAKPRNIFQLKDCSSSDLNNSFMSLIKEKLDKVQNYHEEYHQVSDFYGLVDGKAQVCKVENKGPSPLCLSSIFQSKEMDKNKIFFCSKTQNLSFKNEEKNSSNIFKQDNGEKIN